MGSIPPWLCWENSPDLLSGLRRLWVKAAGCYWCVFLHLNPKASHFFSTSFYFPSASYRTPEGVFPFGVQFIASEKVHAKARKKAEVVSVKRQCHSQRWLGAGASCPQSPARQQGAAGPPSAPPVQRWASLGHVTN